MLVIYCWHLHIIVFLYLWVHWLSGFTFFETTFYSASNILQLFTQVLGIFIFANIKLNQDECCKYDKIST